jgi:hypothetical protein
MRRPLPGVWRPSPEQPAFHGRRELVSVRHDFADRAAADAFFGSAELQQGMTEAGVDTATVQIHLAERA